MFAKWIQRLANLRQYILSACGRFSGKFCAPCPRETLSAMPAPLSKERAAFPVPSKNNETGSGIRHDEALWHENFGLVVPFLTENRHDGLLRFEILDSAGFCSFRMMLDHPARFRAQTIRLPGRPCFLWAEGAAELGLEDLAFAAANRSSLSEKGSTAWTDPEPIWEDCRSRLAKSGLAPGLLAARRDAFASKAVEIIRQAAQNRIIKP